MTRWAVRLPEKWVHRPTGPINPFELAAVVAGIAQGLLVIVGAADPRSVTEALPELLLYVWAALLAAGGGATLAGLTWLGDPFTGVEIKRVGLVAIGFGALVYGSAALLLGSVGLTVAIYNLLLAAACFARLVQVSRRLAQAREHLTNRGRDAA
jgi:hypothetical protein